jgi:hypothetical protein
MTNDEARMTKEARMSKVRMLAELALVICALSFIRLLSFEIRHCS